MLGELTRRLQPVHVQDQEEWREVCAGLEQVDQAVFYPGSALDVTPVRLLEADALEKLMGIRRPVHRAYLFCDCGGHAAGVLQRIYSQLDRGFTADDDPDAGKDQIDIDHIRQMIPLSFAAELGREWKRSGGDLHEDADAAWQAMYIRLIASNGREVDILFIPSDSRKVWERLIERYVGCVRWIFNLKHGGYELAEWLAQRENRCLPDFWCGDRGSAMAQLWTEDSVVAQELWMHERNLRILKNPCS